MLERLLFRMRVDEVDGPTETSKSTTKSFIQANLIMTENGRLAATRNVCSEPMWTHQIDMHPKSEEELRKQNISQVQFPLLKFLKSQTFAEDKRSALSRLQLRVQTSSMEMVDGPKDTRVEIVCM